MTARSVVMLTTGPAGTGKSYWRCAHFLCREFLVESEGRHISNFPIQFDTWSDGRGVERKGLVAYLDGKFDEQTVRDRVRVIDPEEIERWRNDGLARGEKPHGPWETFDGADIAGCHIAIDEIHNFCGTEATPAVRNRWKQWLGEIRHQGATCEFLSQHKAKIHKVIEQEAEVKLSLVGSEAERDPYFGVAYGDWYNLRAKFVTGKYTACVWELEYRMIDGKWSLGRQRKFWFESELFDVYDSFSAPVAGGGAGNTEKRPWERFTKAGLLRWFAWRNGWPVGWRLAAVVLFLWVTLGGGHVYVFKGFAALVASFMPGNKTPAVETGRSVVEIRGHRLDAKGLQSKSVLVANRVGQGGGLEERGFEELAAAEQVHELEGRLVVAAREREEQAKRAADAEKRAEESFAIVLVTKESVTFRGGDTYEIGQRIDWGPYEGQIVKQVEWKRRAVTLGDGRILRMGSGSVGRESAPPAESERVPGAGKAVIASGPGGASSGPKPGTAIQRPLPAAQGPSGRTAGGGGKGTSANNLDQRNAPR